MWQKDVSLWFSARLQRLANQFKGQCLSDVYLCEFTDSERFVLGDKDFGVHLGAVPLGAPNVIVLLLAVNNDAQRLSYLLLLNLERYVLL